jgi:hypothetical protein
MDEDQEASVYGVFIMVVSTVTMIFLVAIFGTVWAGRHTHVSSKADILARHAKTVISPTTNCGPGYAYDADENACAPRYPAPLAMVGAIMDSRFTACGISFSAMMCGVVPPDRQSVHDYATQRHRALALRRLQQTNDVFYHSCLGRGTPAAKRETSIEYRHIIDTLLGDLRVSADLPLTWGRMNRAGFLGAPFRFHLSTAHITADAVTMIDMVHDAGEGRLYQLLQAGPISYNVVELQQRILHLVSIGQKLKHHQSVAHESRTVAFRHIQTWDWPLFLQTTMLPAEDATIQVDDLTFVQWIIQEAATSISVAEWRVWLEFCIAYQHQGHVVSPSCLNNSLGVLPESVNAAILSAVDANQWLKAQSEIHMLPGGLTTSIATTFHSAASLSPDMYDHNVNRAIQRDGDASSGEAIALVDMLPPLYNVAYNDVSKLAIWGTNYYLRQSNLTTALQRIVQFAWPLLPQTSDRQHFFMVWAQAWCTANRSVVDDAIRDVPEFAQVMGCHRRTINLS